MRRTPTDLVVYSPHDVGLFGIGKAFKAVGKAVGGAAKGISRTAKKGLRAVKKTTRTLSPLLDIAATGASFVPGVGTGVAAGLSAAQAMARGKKLHEVLAAGARGAIPGGALGQAAFSTGMGVLRGQRIDRALLAGAGRAVPGGPLGQAAFRSGLALARGQRVDRTLLGAGRSLAQQQLGRFVPSLPRLGPGQRVALSAIRRLGPRVPVARALPPARVQPSRVRLSRAAASGGAAAGRAMAAAQRRAAAKRTRALSVRAAAGGGAAAGRAMAQARQRKVLKMARPLSTPDPFWRFHKVRPKLYAMPRTVRAAQRAVARSPELSTLTSAAAARRLGLPLKHVRRALARQAPRIRWRPLSRPASGLVRSIARSVSPFVLSRYDTQGLSVDGATYTVEKGDYGVKIAEKLVGDGNRWRELRKANPKIAKRPDPKNYGLVIYPGDVLVVPESWRPTPKPVEAIAAASILKAKAELAAWSKTDGATEAGVTDYGLRPEDLSTDWGKRDKFVLAAFSKWHNARGGPSLEPTGELTAAHCDALDDWAEARAKAPPPEVTPATPPVLTPPVVTPPVSTAPPVVTPPISAAPPVVTPPLTTPPVTVTPPVSGAPPVTVPAVTIPPLTVPAVFTPPPTAAPPVTPPAPTAAVPALLPAAPAQAKSGDGLGMALAGGLLAAMFL